MNINPLIIDVAAGVVLAALAIIIFSGAAAAGAIAVLVLLICGITLWFDRRRARTQARAMTRGRVRRRTP
ncbi:MAG TPA: hypothetical protein VFN87_13740 [Solirubrobacteraceae bacterium]|nr:hypothetical protein [Solirubrobacteraceae bacterium]